jgi:hypothetical protein
VVYQMWLYRSVLLGLTPDHTSVTLNLRVMRLSMIPLTL